MNTRLTQSQIQSYRDNGFIAIKNFLTPDELAFWRQAVDEAVEERAKVKLIWQGEDKSSPDNYYNNVFVQRLNLWQSNAKMRQLMLDPRLGKMAASLAGVEGIRIWHDQALNKAPWANPTGWHLDNPYWSFSSRDAISLWVPLDDATLENGCLYYLPGTHKSATFDNVGIGHNIGDLFKVYPQWSNIRAVPVPVKAGSCVFHNGLIAHGAGANMTPGWRRAMTCAYMPDGSTFNGKQNVLPPDYMAKLNVGDLIEDDAHVPLIYHPSKKCVSAD